MDIASFHFTYSLGISERKLSFVHLFWLFCGEGMCKHEGYGHGLLCCSYGPEATVQLLSLVSKDAESLSCWVGPQAAVHLLPRRTFHLTLYGDFSDGWRMVFIVCMSGIRLCGLYVSRKLQRSSRSYSMLSLFLSLGSQVTRGTCLSPVCVLLSFWLVLSFCPASSELPLWVLFSREKMEILLLTCLELSRSLNMPHFDLF